jgi:hypothetical protein
MAPPLLAPASEAACHVPFRMQFPASSPLEAAEMGHFARLVVEHNLLAPLVQTFRVTFLSTAMFASLSLMGAARPFVRASSGPLFTDTKETA